MSIYRAYQHLIKESDDSDGMLLTKEQKDIVKNNTSHKKGEIMEDLMALYNNHRTRKWKSVHWRTSVGEDIREFIEYIRKYTGIDDYKKESLLKEISHICYHMYVDKVGPGHIWGMEDTPGRVKAYTEEEHEIMTDIIKRLVANMYAWYIAGGTMENIDEINKVVNKIRTNSHMDINPPREYITAYGIPDNVMDIIDMSMI